MNLFEVARDNAAAYLQRYEDLRSTTDPAAVPALERFFQAVEQDGRLAVNRRQTVLVRFLALRGRFYNLYEWADYLAGISGRPREELLREQLKDWYDRRMVFDHHLEHGERLRYGALNLGGLGSVHFGDYCLVFAESFAAGLAELAWLPADSLKTYLLPDGTVDEAGLRRDACPHSHRHHLAALKHGAEAAAAPEAHWPALLCSHAGFLEGLFVAQPSPGDLQAVRMKRSDFDLYMHFMVDGLLNRMGQSDNQLLQEFDTLLGLLRERSIPLDKVDA